MKLNPVYEFIKNHDTFTYLDVHNTLHEKVVSTEYLRQAFFYFAQGAFIKKIDDPMPEQVLLWVSADYDSDESKKTGEICFKPDGTEHWGYQAYKWFGPYGSNRIEWKNIHTIKYLSLVMSYYFNRSKQ